MPNKTLGEVAKDLNRSIVYLRGLQSRFELPAAEGAGCTPAYQSFLQTLVRLRTFAISEENLQHLWHIEKKLLQLLHVEGPDGIGNAREQLPVVHEERREGHDGDGA